MARPVNKAEVRVTPAAQAALQKEWDKLRAAGCWDESGVREWADVASEARRKNAKAHVGMIFDICVEKGSELPKGDPGRKFKGRVVFQGKRPGRELERGSVSGAWFEPRYHGSR